MKIEVDKKNMEFVIRFPMATPAPDVAIKNINVITGCVDEKFIAERVEKAMKYIGKEYCTKDGGEVTAEKNSILLFQPNICI